MPNGLNTQYLHVKGFDPAKLQTGIFEFLRKHQPGYAPTAAETSTRIINRLGSDPRVTDIRYMAYMLATACHEAKEIKKFSVPKVIKGKLALDPKTKQPVMVDRKLWEIFVPIDELGQGKGRPYFEPVKVEKITEGALITEKDGDQFKIRADLNRKVFKLTEGTGLTTDRKDGGSVSGGPVAIKYKDAAGDEHQYFGRGLVQLTWWFGYLQSSLAFGYGMDLLLDPEKVKNFEVAYDIMVQGMTTGGGYANGRKCSDYFSDVNTDYVKARAMINGSDKANDIASLALAFETLLTDARLP